jgi:hypothetical protein
MSEKQQDFPPDICGNVIEHLNEEIERYSLYNILKGPSGQIIIGPD